MKAICTLAVLFVVSLLGCAPSYDAERADFLSRENIHTDGYLLSKIDGHPFSPLFYHDVDSAFRLAIANAAKHDSLDVTILATIHGDIWGLYLIDSLDLGSKHYYEDKKAMLDTKFTAASSNERSKRK